MNAFTDARVAIVALLNDPDLPKVVGLEDLDPGERTTLLITSCATVISYMLVVSSGHKAETGLDILVDAIKENIRDLLSVTQ